MLSVQRRNHTLTLNSGWRDVVPSDLTQGCVLIFLLPSQCSFCFLDDDCSHGSACAHSVNIHKGVSIKNSIMYTYFKDERDDPKSPLEGWAFKSMTVVPAFCFSSPLFFPPLCVFVFLFRHSQPPSP